MGVVVRLPVYSSGPRPSDVAQRRAREIGALGISMRVRPMLLAALPPDALHRYRVRVLDTTGETTMTLYDSGGHVAPGASVYGGGVSFGERRWRVQRSEEHTSELQSLMRISYAVFCLKKKTKNKSK